MRRRRAIAAACVAALLLGVGAGCGNERQDAPRVARAATPSGKSTESLASSGVAFARPSNWTLTAGTAPELAVVSSGRAFVTLWRYKRVESLPRSEQDLVHARQALVKAARARDRTLRVISAQVLRRGNVPAVQILATEKVGAVRRKVRSTHLYAHGAELVVDAYAPPDEFAEVDRTTFLPLLRSLRVTAPMRPRS